MNRQVETGQPQKIGNILRRIDNTDIPAYKIWNDHVDGKINMDEFKNKTAQLILDNLDDFKFRLYPVKTGFVAKYAALDFEGRRKLIEKATPDDLEQLHNYEIAFGKAKNQNIGNHKCLLELINSLPDSESISKVADFIEKHYEPWREKLLLTAYDEFRKGAREWNQ